MRLAIIDLGTNSVRFDVHEIGPENEVYRLHREKLMIRLGEGVFMKGRLNAQSMELCIAAFRSFKRTMTDFKVHRVIAFGTATLREAKDAEKLINRIKRETDIHLRILPGEEEARLIARGILTNEIGLRGSYALVDIGGGSTEVIACQGKEVLAKTSFELGTARLQQVFLKSIPPKAVPGNLHPIDQLRRHIRGTLLYRLVSENWPKRNRILGSSGTVKALLKIIKRRTGKNFISRDDLKSLVKEMATMNRSDLMRISGMEARRVDMILAGAILLEECMNAFRAEKVEATEFSLRDGILDEQIEILNSHRNLLKHDPIQDLFETAKDLGAKEKELSQAIKTAEILFEKLKSLHRLGPDWKVYLIAGALLHDSGRSISAINSAEHSAYVARYADVPQFEDWESELIALLCFHSKTGKLQKKELPFKKDKSTQRAFLKLLAILRLVAAISFQRSESIPVQRVRVNGKRVTLSLSRRSKPALGMLRVDQRKSLFEDVFKKNLQIEQV